MITDLRVLQAGYSQASGTAHYTFTDMDLGDEFPERVIVACISARVSGTSREITGVTIGGVPADSRQEFNNANNTTLTAIAWAVVPSGTVGDVEIVFDANAPRVFLQMYWLAGVKPTPTTFASSGQISVSTQDWGIVVASVCVYPDGHSFEWTGLHKDYEASTGLVSHSTASKRFVLGIGETQIYATPIPANTTRRTVLTYWSPIHRRGFPMSRLVN